jgi:GDP-L-fucose synthase
MNKDSKIYIAGHRGMVGSAIERQLKRLGYTLIIGRSSKELDLRNEQSVREFFKDVRPTIVIDAAAKVGGILANNNHPYPF